jgi:hypothetical protein
MRLRLYVGPPIQATVICPPGHQITITAIVLGQVKCTIHIPEQSDLQGIIMKNSKEPTPDDSDVSFDITKQIKYATTKGPGPGGCTETEAKTDGDFIGKVTVQGTAGGVASDIWYE